MIRDRGRVTPIDVLNDDVLLVIFDFCVAYDGNQDRTKQAWQSLVHVCQRWRTLVFESPRRLNLQLRCTTKTPAKDTLDIWPALPLIVSGNTAESGTHNIIAALGHSNRVSQVEITASLGCWRNLEEVLAPMHVPFPELTDLRLYAYAEIPQVIPDLFLGGSAPRLKYVELNAIPFPGLPKLLLSANHLVYLGLWNIPPSGYISPEAMVAPLSVLSSLETLFIGFQSSQSRPDLESISLPPLERSILPSLDEFRFIGDTEYLEDLVTFINAPQINHFCITFFSQIDFDTPQLTQFIDRTPGLRARDAHVQFHNFFASVRSGALEILVPRREPGHQVSFIERVCNSSFRPFSTVEDLYIEHQYLELIWKIDAIENTQWLQLLHPFTTVKNLYLSKEFAPGIAAALQELVGDRITEVLPNLRNIFVKELEPSGPFQGNIWQFVALRQLSGHLIAISLWDDSKIKPM